MTAITFYSVPLPHASKLSEDSSIRIKEVVLLSGKPYVQSNTNRGFGASYSCLCTWGEYGAILACIGVSGSLVTINSTYTNCFISSLKVQETDSPGYYRVDVSFRQGVT